jgi:[ribosomal protein S5]-alanine N-acetyltransferase
MDPSSAPPRATIARLDELDLVLVTQRLRLRPIQESDVEDLWPYVSDPDVPRMMSWQAHTDRNDTLEFIRHCRRSLAGGTDMVWTIEHDGRAAGCISLDDIKFVLRAWRVDRAELGYWLAPPLWGQGLMTEAARAVLRFGFEAVGLHKIVTGCLVENVGSRRVIEKVGFRALGRREDDVWRDGRWWSMLRYELTAAAWGALPARDATPRPP